MLACLALSALFLASEAKAAALGLNEVTTEVKRQVAADDFVARTLQNAISPERPSWDKVIQPQLAQREEQIRVENERLAKEKAEAEAKAKQVVVVQPAATPIAQPTDAKMFIYMHESGNRTTAVNSIGCRGLGQACPGSKLPCGDDYACQDAWFTQYMLGRYGTWENAMAFWVAHSWW